MNWSNFIVDSTFFGKKGTKIAITPVPCFFVQDRITRRTVQSEAIMYSKGLPPGELLKINSQDYLSLSLPRRFFIGSWSNYGIIPDSLRMPFALSVE